MVSGSQRPLHCRRHRASFAADVERIACGIICYSQQIAVASDAAGGVRREALPAVEFATTGVARGQRFRGNVDDYLITPGLIALGRWLWPKALTMTVAQRGFRHRRQGVGAALRESVFVYRRYRGNVIDCVLMFLFALRVDRGIERLQHDGAFLGRQPCADDEAAIVVVVIIQFTRGMTCHCLLALCETTNTAHDAAIRAHQFFDLGCGGVKREFEQFFFVDAVGDAGQRAHLGETEPAAFEGRAYRRQTFQCVRYADLFTRRIHADAAAPV